MAALPLRLEDLSPKLLETGLLETRKTPLSLGVPSLDEALPDGGFPTGAVVEMCAPMGLSRITHLAMRACASAQEASRQTARSTADSDWTAWIDPNESGSLFAPALVRAGVDLTRLLVVRPNPEDIARVAVRMASSRLFRVIVIDRSGLPGASIVRDGSRARWSTVVRRLALAAESSDTTILLLSSTERAHRDLLPTAMRIELTRPNHKRLQLNITKDRRGRMPGPVSVPVADLTFNAA